MANYQIENLQRQITDLAIYSDIYKKELSLHQESLQEILRLLKVILEEIK